jgi:hypothetical protein
MQNSVSQEVTGQTVAGEIRLLRATHNGAFLIVEGHDDARLLGGFARKDCSITIAIGFENALAAIELLNDWAIPGVLCIVDADFSRLHGPSRALPRVVVTEACDLDAIIFLSPALTFFLQQFGSRAKIARMENATGKDIQEYIAQEARKIAALRFLSITNNWALHFQCVDYTFVNGGTLTVDIDELIKKITRRSKKIPVGVVDIRKMVDAVVASRASHDDLCSGHDLIAILAKGLKKAIGNLKAAQAEEGFVLRCLHLAFSTALFQQTVLFAAIRDWEATNPPFEVLA